MRITLHDSREKPILSGRLRIAVLYCRVAAVGLAAVMLYEIAVAAYGDSLTRASMIEHPIAWAIGPAAIGAWWYAAALLGRARRTGMWVALASLTVPLAAYAAYGFEIDRSEIIFALAGATFLLSAWRQLR